MSDQVEKTLRPPMDAYLGQLLREAREEVLHADAKASILLAALSVGMGATLGGVIASQWTPVDLSNDVEWMWWIGAALLVVSIVSSAASVWPRYESGGERDRPIYFWGDTEGLANPTELLDALRERPPDLEERGADQFLKLSSIVIAKYSLIRRALRAAGVGAVLCATAVFLNALCEPSGEELLRLTQLEDDLRAQAVKVFAEQWKTTDAQKVPETGDIALGNEAKKLEAVVLYSDLRDSTELVRRYNSHFAAEIYKTFLYSASRIIRNRSGVVTAFDGDRVMGVFIGDAKNSNAATCGRQINYAVSHIIQPALEGQYSETDYTIRHTVGVDRSEFWVARTGIRGSNDLVWVGDAANQAAT